MFQTIDVEARGKKLFRAVTHLRTFLIGFQNTVGENEVDDLANKCEAHEHGEGFILEVGRLE